MLINNYQKYFNEYNNYANKHTLGKKYLYLGHKIAQTKYYQILYYKKLANSNIVSHKKIFLIIPSIFNSPEILFLSKSKSFIDNLRILGEVFLVDWYEVKETNYSLNNYVERSIEIIIDLARQNNILINLIGHCIGGNLAIASSIILPHFIKTLTLLTSPWDFSHLSMIRTMYQYCNLDHYIQDLAIIPKIHIQILFFLLYPNNFNIKLNKFFSLTSEKEKDLFFRIEHWLMSGVALPKDTYYQIMNDLIDNNILANIKWKINNKYINPTIIDRPIYQVIANNDQIVPISSILSLHKSAKNSKIFEVEGGHISYLINNKIDNLFKVYKNE